MDKTKDSAIGERIKALRKKRGYNQKELADLLGKSLRTVQKYESGEIEISIAVINQLAKLLDTTSTYLIGQRTGDFKFETMSDVMDCLFQLEKITGLHFSVDVKRPPYHDGWQCSIVFDGKEPAADLNADLCLFLESWKDNRETFAHYGMTKTAYEQWKDRTLAYYAVQPIKLSEPEELETSERIKKRNAFLSGLTRDES